MCAVTACQISFGVDQPRHTTKKARHNRIGRLESNYNSCCIVWRGSAWINAPVTIQSSQQYFHLPRGVNRLSLSPQFKFRGDPDHRDSNWCLADSILVFMSKGNFMSKVFPDFNALSPSIHSAAPWGATKPFCQRSRCVGPILPIRGVGTGLSSIWDTGDPDQA
jgi:hypothetical protein